MEIREEELEDGIAEVAAGKEVRAAGVPVDGDLEGGEAEDETEASEDLPAGLPDPEAEEHTDTREGENDGQHVAADPADPAHEPFAEHGADRTADVRGGFIARSKVAGVPGVQTDREKRGKAQQQERQDLVGRLFAHRFMYPLPSSTGVSPGRGKSAESRHLGDKRACHFIGSFTPFL